MKNATISYNSDYFESGIFETDYQSLALTIFELYHPKTVAEFGCGPGHLSRELAKLGIQVTAVDGYSRPDFSGLSVDFYPLNLNDPKAIANLFTGKSFDLAVSLEVAEHLQPSVSPLLVNWLSNVAPVVVFAAAVPGQGGHGHINLRPRDYWHSEFTQHDFVLADRLREKLRIKPHVAPWYQINTLDYVHVEHHQAPQPDEVIHRLIASESAAATAYFNKCNELHVAHAYLSYAPVKGYLSLRQFTKRLLGKKG